MTKLFIGVLLTAGIISSTNAQGYACTTSKEDKFEFSVMLQGRALDWSYGFLSGEAVGVSNLGSPLGHWRNPDQLDQRFYVLYELTNKGHESSLLAAIQYVRPMFVSDVVILKKEGGVLIPVETLYCTLSRETL